MTSSPTPDTKNDMQGVGTRTEDQAMGILLLGGPALFLLCVGLCCGVALWRRGCRSAEEEEEEPEEQSPKDLSRRSKVQRSEKSPEERLKELETKQKAKLKQRRSDAKMAKRQCPRWAPAAPQGAPGGSG